MEEITSLVKEVKLEPEEQKKKSSHYMLTLGIMSMISAALFAFITTKFGAGSIKSHVADTTLGALNDTRICSRSSGWNELYLKTQPIIDGSWGSYRPGIYFGMKTKTVPDFISTGIMWTAYPQHTQSYRHFTKQDELSVMSWIRHDGKTYGVQRLVDTTYNIDLTGSFIIPDKSIDNTVLLPTWVQRFNLSHIHQKKSSGGPSSDHALLFYFGLECDGNIPVDRCITPSKVKSFRVIQRDNWDDGMAASVVLVGYTRHTGWFNLEVNLYCDDSIALDVHPTLSHWLAGKSSVSEALKRLQAPPIVRGRTVQQAFPIFTEDGDLQSKAELNVGAAVFQARATTPLVLQVALYDHLDVNNEAEAVEMAKKNVFTTDPRDVSLWMTTKENEFEEKFKSTFRLDESSHTDTFSDIDKEAAKHALSAVLGGIGFFHGVPDVADALDFFNYSADPFVGSTQRAPETLQASATKASRQAISLLCSTPSRTAFPRGFLWDEGFHQLLIGAWDPSLSMQIIRSWMGGMYVFGSAEAARETTAKGSQSPLCGGGWIPREMILGEEARGRVPAEFVTQRVNIANPPTLLLAVDALLARAGKLTSTKLCEDNQGRGREQVCKARNEEHDEIIRFLEDVAPALSLWVRGLLASQSGTPDVPGAFRWRGRSSSDGKVLPNTLASGLDDYPRSAVPSPDEYHVDLLCWMAKATEVLEAIERVLIEACKYKGTRSDDCTSTLTKSIQSAAYLRQRIEDLHWSEEHSAYLDVGLHSERGRMQTEVIVRCTKADNSATIDVPVPMEALQSGQVPSEYCPQEHPHPMYPLGDGHGGLMQRQRFIADRNTSAVQHIPRIGYVSLFPVLLRILSPESPRLASVLRLMEEPTLLWTDFGLRSLAATDRFYRRKNAPGDEPYWRGPIWININYLALSALHHYGSLEGPHRTRIVTLYKKLRHNVLRTVLGEYHRTGFFWEQYDDVSGQGIRGHPFTGWTVLVLNIMSEIY